MNFGNLGDIAGGVAGGGQKAKDSSKKPKQAKGYGSSSGSYDQAGHDLAASESLKKGGKIRKTKTYRLHKGERVLTVKQTRKYDRRKGS